MRLLFAMLVVGFVAVPACAATYDVTASMPTTSGATSCQLYLNGTATGAMKPCGSAQSYAALLPSEGTYQFAYKAVNSGGQSALSPVTTVIVTLTPPPSDPSSPPTISVSCNPAPCAPNIVITVTP